MEKLNFPSAIYVAKMVLGNGSFEIGQLADHLDRILHTETMGHG